MNEPQNSTLKTIISLLEILEGITQSEEVLRDLVHNVGWDLDELTGFTIEELSRALGPLSNDLQHLLPFLEDAPDSFSEIATTLQHSKQAFSRIVELKTAIEQAEFDGPDRDKLKEFSKDLLNFLLVLTIRSKSPVLFHVLFLLTLLDYEESNIDPIVTADGRVIRYPSAVPRLQLGKIGDLLSDPVDLLGNYYFPNSLQTDADALYAAHKLFPRVENLLHEFGFNTMLGFNPQHGLDLGPQSNELATGMLTIFSEPAEHGLEYGVTLALSPASRANLGLVLTPFGQLNFSEAFGDWLIGLELTAGVQAFALGPEGAELLAGPETAQVELHFRADKLPVAEAGPAYLLGGRSGTRLEINVLRVSTALKIQEAAFDLDILLEAAEAAFVLMPGDGDGFLASLLPESGVRLDFDLGLGWSRQKGVYFKGKAGLEAVYEFHRSLLGLLKLQSLRLQLLASGQGLSFLTDGILEVQIGPLRGLLANMGVGMDVDFVEEGGNSGVADTDLYFKPPDGLGFVIDAQVVRGGGFLGFADGEYLGFAELEVLDRFTLKAIGIITTKLPDGRSGYSFLLMITAEFAPVPLGFGFTLEGVGGLIGLHRDLHLENIQAGVATGAYDYILFPRDPLGDLPKIIAGINAILPIRENQYAFGLLARIGWGSPKLLDIKAGLIFALPSWKLALIGVATAEIERKQKTLVRLQLNFAITFDPGSDLFTFDGSLTNSRLLSWDLEGDFAIRIRGGNDPYFLLSAGGFHRDFIPPAGLRLPKLRPMKVTIADGNPDIYAQFFFAITTNTIQLGGLAHAEYSKYGIGFKADLGFEALLQFNPLYFRVDVWGEVSLHFFGSSFGLGLRGTVEGPYPLVISLYVTFKVWIFSKTVRVPTITIGSSRDTSLEGVAVWPILREQLADERNWEPYLPARNRVLVSVRSGRTEPAVGEQPRQEVRKFHPVGGVLINQLQVPLNLPMDHFGHQPIQDFRHFSLRLDAAGRSVESVREFFAPSQFFELTDDEKFNRKAFEKQDSGVRLSDWDTITGGGIAEKEATYEERIIAPDTGEVSKQESTDTWQDFDQFRQHTSIVQSRQGNRQKQQMQRQSIRRKEERFALVDGFQLQVIEDGSGNKIQDLTESEVHLLRRQRQAAQPELAGRLQVVPMHEL